MSASHAQPDPLLTELVRCPRCRGRIHPSNPSWTCASCGFQAPVVLGVPRLAANLYVESFGRQWNRYDVARPEEDAAVFQAKTGIDPSTLSGQVVLDAGCGGGRYARLLGEKGARVLGVDLSSAVEKAAALCASMPNVRILQADLLDLPLQDRQFDLAFSIGVLHHSPDPRRAFAQVASKVRPGGRLAVWLYRRNLPPQEWVNSALRLVSTRLPARVLEAGSVGLGVLGGIPIVNRTLNKAFNFSSHPDWTLRVCDNFDWYAPRYQSHHSSEELKRWFEEEGFTNLVELSPLKTGRLYDWTYRHNLLIGSGVNFLGTRREDSVSVP